jgi:gluconate kinase
MIIVLVGTWGSGKSYIGDLIERHTGIPHMEADLQFDKSMTHAIRSHTYHEVNLDPFFNRVVAEMISFQKRAPQFTVSLAIYREEYRKMIYDLFQPDIHFVWVSNSDVSRQRNRILDRAASGSPITGEVYDNMLRHWDMPKIPHKVIENSPAVKESLPALLDDLGVFFSWEE